MTEAAKRFIPRSFPFPQQVINFVRDKTNVGDTFTASDICDRMGGRAVTTGRVNGVLRYCPYVEYIPEKVIKTGKNVGKRMGCGRYLRIYYQEPEIPS